MRRLVIAALVASLSVVVTAQDTYDVNKNGGNIFTGTLAALKAFVENLIEPPPDHPPPPPPPQDPSDPCYGYDERRAAFEVQGWWAKNGNINDAAHLHVGGCLPVAPVTGQMPINALVRAFHKNVPGALLKQFTVKATYIPESAITFPTQVPGAQKGTFNIPITEHLQDIVIPIVIDTTQALYDGDKSMMLEAILTTPDDRGASKAEAEAQEFHVPLRTVNGRPVLHAPASGLLSSWRVVKTVAASPTNPCPNGQVECEKSLFGYINTTVTQWNVNNPGSPWGILAFVDDPWPNWFLRGNGNAQSQLQMGAFHNPDMHLHPPDRGTVIYDDVPFTGSKTTFPVSPFPLVTGDRYVFRTTDISGGSTGEWGAAAAVISVKVGPAQE